MCSTGPNSNLVRMTKRLADKPLDYDNWDAPDDPIKPGAFERADEATIKARNIIIPKRKSAQMVAQPRRGLFKSLDVFGRSEDSSSPSTSVPSPNSECKSDAYLSKLATLNKEVSAWISKHVAKDPFCILTPIFNDYAKHLASIETLTGSTTPEMQPTTAVPTPSSTGELSVQKTIFSIPPPPQSTVACTTATTTTTSISGGFNFQFKSSESTETSASAKPPLFFGLGTATTCSNNLSQKPPVFSFTSAPPKPAEDPISCGAVSADTPVDQGM